MKNEEEIVKRPKELPNGDKMADKYKKSKKYSSEINKIRNKRMFIGIALFIPFVIYAWKDFIFDDISPILMSIINVTAIISPIVGVYTLYRSSYSYVFCEVESKDSKSKESSGKIILDGRIVEVDSNGIVKEKKEKKENKKVPLFYKIPYDIMKCGLFAIWGIVGGYAADNAKYSPLLEYFPSENFLLCMLLAADTIVCLGIWFLYMGYFHKRKTRILYLVLIVVIYLAFYSLVKRIG